MFFSGIFQGLGFRVLGQKASGPKIKNTFVESRTGDPRIPQRGPKSPRKWREGTKGGS